MSKRSEIVEVLAAIASFVLILVLFWLFLIATPDQLSGEADLFREQMKALEK